MCGVVALQSPGASKREIRLRIAQGMERLNNQCSEGFSVTIDGSAGVGVCKRDQHESISEPRWSFHGRAYHNRQDLAHNHLEGQHLLETGQQLDGMWAAVHLDKYSQLKVYRDPWGIKALWVRKRGDDFLISTELNPLLQDGKAPARRYEAIEQFLAFGSVIDGGSFWHGIHSIPPGTHDRNPDFLIGALSHVRKFTSVERSSDPSDEEIQSAISEAIKIAVNSGNSVGLALSGGLDSTIIAHHLMKMDFENLTTVSVRMQGSNEGISSLRQLSISSTPKSWEHHVSTIRSEDFLPLLRRVIHSTGRPTGLTSAPLYLALYDSAIEAGIRTLVVGEGADELWGGYRSYLGVTKKTSIIDFYCSNYKYQILSLLIGNRSADEIMSRLETVVGSGAGPEKLRNAEFIMSLGPLLDRTESAAISQAIEIRTPFLHREAAAIASIFPWRRLVAGGQTKLALRSAYQSQLPRFLKEQKKPFRAPWSTWLSNGLREPVNEIIRGNLSSLETLGIKPRHVVEVFEASIHGNTLASEFIYRICSLIFWLEVDNS